MAVGVGEGVSVIVAEAVNVGDGVGEEVPVGLLVTVGALVSVFTSAATLVVCVVAQLISSRENRSRMNNRNVLLMAMMDSSIVDSFVMGKKI